MLVVFVMRSTKRYDVESLPTNVSRPLQLMPPRKAMREPFHWPVKLIVTVIFGFEPLRVPVHLPARLWSGVVAAESWYQKAADLGDSDAMFSLGWLAYDAGDLELAESWWQKAADLGNPNAIEKLAELDAS